MLEGFWHSGHGDTGTQPTETDDPAGLGSGTPVGGVVIGVGGWQAGSDEDESGVHAWPLGAGGGAGGAGWAAAAAVAGAAAALIASVPLSTTTRLTTSAGPRLRSGRRCGRGAAGAVVLAEGGNSSFRCLVGAGRGWVHWTKGGGPPSPKNVKVDLWPDVSELGADERFDTEFKDANGRPAQVFVRPEGETRGGHGRLHRRGRRRLNSTAGRRAGPGGSDARTPP